MSERINDACKENATSTERKREKEKGRTGGGRIRSAEKSGESEDSLSINERVCC